MNAIAKYRAEPKFRSFVDQMVATINNKDFTATEIRQASIVASIIIEQKNYNTVEVIAKIECLESLLKLSDVIDANAQST